jgi:cytochrome c-type biogenesis protein
MVLADFFAAFVLGLLTPLTAVCVLPLYPGFLAYLSSKLSGKPSRKLLILFGVVITAGVIVFMFLLGLLFTTILEVSLTKVIGIVSPIAFGILTVISILLIFNVDVGRFLPKVQAPVVKNPLFSAFVFGFFFGAIVIPCNPLFIAALFTRTLASMDFVSNIVSFLAFGVGIGFPLLVFSAISATASSAIINFLTRQKKIINRVAGVIMLIISLYYLIFVFRIFG